VAAGEGGTAHARIQLVNQLGGVFVIQRIVVALDGALRYSKTDTGGGFSDRKSIPLVSGSLPPGDHTLQVMVRLRGSGYGVFSYVNGYKFEVRSHHRFTVAAGKSADFDVVVFEKGGVTLPIEQRPTIGYPATTSETKP